jgi:hypothetical protein
MRNDVKHHMQKSAFEALLRPQWKHFFFKKTGHWAKAGGSKPPSEPGPTLSASSSIAGVLAGDLQPHRMLKPAKLPWLSSKWPLTADALSQNGVHLARQGRQAQQPRGRGALKGNIKGNIKGNL